MGPYLVYDIVTIMKELALNSTTVDSKGLEEGPGTIYAGFLLPWAWGLEDRDIPTFWLLL